MKSLIHKIKAILSDNKGETLMESVVSVLIFNILMLSVTMMIRTSLSITENSTRTATERQTKANEAILEDYAYTPKKLVLTGTLIEVEIPVNYTADTDPDAFQAFTPAP